MSGDAAGVKRELQWRMLDLCHFLLPGGKKRGHEYRCGSKDGGPGESFSVHLSGTKAGMFGEFNGGDRGDVFGLIQLVRGCTFVEALDWAREFCGIERPTFKQTAKREYRKPDRPAGARKTSDGEPGFGYLTRERGLSPETVAAFKIAEGPYPEWMEYAGGESILFPYKRGDELVMVKWLLIERPNGKKEITTSKDAEPCLFGWQAVDAEARTIVIAEGEIDAMTWSQMGFPALSPPRGTGDHGWIDTEWERLERFEAVYLAYDDDEAGRKAIEKIAPRFGDRARVVGHLASGKDANTWLLAGATAEDFAGLIRNAKETGPLELRGPLEYRDKVHEKFYPTSGEQPGARAPYNSVVDRVRFRPSEMSLWTGYNHHGKTNALEFCMVSVASEGEMPCVAFLESPPESTVAHFVRMVTAERQPSPATIDAALEWLEERFRIYDRSGATNVGRIVEVFEYAARRFGCTQFVVDNLAMLGIGEDDYNAQKAAVLALLDFAHASRGHVHLVAHPRKGADETKAPGKLDVRGGAAISDLVHNVFCHWKDVAKSERISNLEASHDPNGEILPLMADAPDAVWRVLKQRETGDTPVVNLWWHRDSLQFKERYDAHPKIYITKPEVQSAYDRIKKQAERQEPDFPQWVDDGKPLPF